MPSQTVDAGAPQQTQVHETADPTTAPPLALDSMARTTTTTVPGPVEHTFLIPGASDSKPDEDASPSDATAKETAEGDVDPTAIPPTPTSATAVVAPPLAVDSTTRTTTTTAPEPAGQNFFVASNKPDEDASPSDATAKETAEEEGTAVVAIAPSAEGSQNGDDDGVHDFRERPHHGASTKTATAQADDDENDDFALSLDQLKNRVEAQRPPPSPTSPTNSTDRSHSNRCYRGGGAASAVPATSIMRQRRFVAFSVAGQSSPSCDSSSTSSSASGSRRHQQHVGRTTPSASSSAEGCVRSRTPSTASNDSACQYDTNNNDDSAAAAAAKPPPSPKQHQLRSLLYEKKEAKASGRGVLVLRHHAGSGASALSQLHGSGHTALVTVPRQPIPGSEAILDDVLCALGAFIASGHPIPVKVKWTTAEIAFTVLADSGSGVAYLYSGGTLDGRGRQAFAFDPYWSRERLEEMMVVSVYRSRPPASFSDSA